MDPMTVFFTILIAFSFIVYGLIYYKTNKNNHGGMA